MSFVTEYSDHNSITSRRRVCLVTLAHWLTYVRLECVNMQKCVRSNSYLRQEIFTWMTRHVSLRDMTRLWHDVCDMTPRSWRDSLTRWTRLIHMFDTTHSHVWHDSLTNFSCVCVCVCHVCEWLTTASGVIAVCVTHCESLAHMTHTAKDAANVEFLVCVCVCVSCVRVTHWRISRVCVCVCVMCASDSRLAATFAASARPDKGRCSEMFEVLWEVRPPEMPGFLLATLFANHCTTFSRVTSLTQHPQKSDL